jgi:hypothetical protein
MRFLVENNRRLAGLPPQQDQDRMEALRRYRCCTAPAMCGARCQDDEASDLLAFANAEVDRLTAERHVCGCDNDPLECSHEAAVDEMEERVRRLTAERDKARASLEEARNAWASTHGTAVILGQLRTAEAALERVRALPDLWCRYAQAARSLAFDGTWMRAAESLSAALSDQADPIAGPRDEFLAASVAVWREIDRLSAEPGGYRGLAGGTDLRVRERAAWEAYRAVLDAPADRYYPIADEDVSAAPPDRGVAAPLDEVLGWSTPPGALDGAAQPASEERVK